MGRAVNTGVQRCERRPGGGWTALGVQELCLDSQHLDSIPFHRVLKITLHAFEPDLCPPSAAERTGALDIYL